MEIVENRNVSRSGRAVPSRERFYELTPIGMPGGAAVDEQYAGDEE